MKDKSLSLFDNKKLWEEEWEGMPEYNNVREEDPLITATFKFKTEEDFELFKSLIRDHLYDGAKVFDGMQRATSKSAWFPPKDKASKYRYR